MLFWHRKGGTGKTSLALGCALALVRAAPHARVLLIDTDPQGTAAAWGERCADAAGVLVRADSGRELWTRNAPLLKGFDRVLVDCAPSVTAETLDLLTGPHGPDDRLLIPTRPAWPDVWALEGVAELLAGLCADPGAGQPLAARVLFNQVGDEALAPFVAAVTALGLVPWPTPIPTDAAWPGLFSGGAPPASVPALLGALG